MINALVNNAALQEEDASNHLETPVVVVREEKATLGKLKFGSSDDLMALAVQSFAGTRTAKIINQFKDWDSTHSVETAISKTNSSDNLLETVPGHSLLKYYDDYNADKAQASRKTVKENSADHSQNKDDIENQETSEEAAADGKNLHGMARILENIFHIEERGKIYL